jgi:membrane fusion protein (multidrug efflux system)
VTNHAWQQSAASADSNEDTVESDSNVDELTTRSASVRPFPAPHATAPATEERPPARSKRIIVAIVLIAGAVVAWGALRKPAAPPQAAQPAVVAPLELSKVDVAVAEPRPLSRRLPLSGSLAPVVQATVKSKVGGEVEELTVREGQDVREGQVIARLDTRNLQAQYDRELAAVEKARAELELAKLNREKNRALLEQKFISQNTFEQTESAYFGSVANLKLAEAQARLAKINLDDAVIRAPFSGTIARRLVQPGEKVSPDGPIVQLVDLGELLLEAAVPAAEIPAVRIGQTARFTVGGFGDREFVGNVQRINPTTSDGSRAITIYVAVPNPDRALKGGMFAQGELILDADEPVLSIPYSAVRFEAGSPIVYLLADGKIERRAVVIGEHVEGSEFVEVRSGVKPGERVIVADIGDHKPGDAAYVRGEQSPAPVATTAG